MRRANANATRPGRGVQRLALAGSRSSRRSVLAAKAAPGREHHHHAQRRQHQHHRAQQAIRARAGAAAARSGDPSRAVRQRPQRRPALAPRTASAALAHRAATLPRACFMACPRPAASRSTAAAEHVAPVVVVAEHVEAGAGRRQHHRVARAGQPAARAATASSRVAGALDHGHHRRPAPRRCDRPPRRSPPPPAPPPAGPRPAARSCRPCRGRRRSAPPGAGTRPGPPPPRPRWSPSSRRRSATPSTLAHQDHPVGQRRGTSAAPRRTSSAVAPSSRAARAAASAFSRLCRPTSPGDWRRVALERRRRAGAGTARSPSQPAGALDLRARPAGRRGGQRHHLGCGTPRGDGAAPADRRRSPRRSRRGPWAANSARLGRGVGLQVGVAVQVIGA